MKKKSLVGWTDKRWELYRGVSVSEVYFTPIYKNKDDNEEQENVKVRITIEEV